jgi:hypothetical protein
MSGDFALASSPEQIVDLILVAKDYDERSRILDQQRECLTSDVPDALCRHSRSVVRSDPREALDVSRVAIRASRLLRDPEREREALRIAARAGAACGRFHDALRYLDAASVLAGTNRCVRARIDVERAECLAHLEDFDEARAAARRAMAWFGRFESETLDLHNRLALAGSDGSPT